MVRNIRRVTAFFYCVGMFFVCGDYKVCKNWSISELFVPKTELFSSPPRNQMESEFGPNFECLIWHFTREPYIRSRNKIIIRILHDILSDILQI
jgi:hypothetical protein